MYKGYHCVCDWQLLAKQQNLLLRVEYVNVSLGLGCRQERKLRNRDSVFFCFFLGAVNDMFVVRT